MVFPGSANLIHTCTMQQADSNSMLTAIRWRAAKFLLAVILLVSTVHAQTGAQELRVVTRVLPPLVVEQQGQLSGFSIDLWNKITERLQMKTTYQIAPDVRALLQEIRSGNAAVGISAISITAAREKEFDFSQPMLNAGLQIMVRGKGQDADPNPLWDLLGLLFSKAILVWLGIALLLILVPAHLVWLLERGHKDGIIPTKNYYPGIFYAMFWAAGTLATQGEQMPRQWLARAIAVLWMFTGVVFVAFYTAQLAATLTVQQIQGGIHGPDDLQGRRVATTRGSTAAAFLRELKAQVQEVSGIDEAYQVLLNKDVDAVVFDAPVLLYYAANAGKGRVHMVGSIFRKEDYGIVFQLNNPLRKQVNDALLVLREDGTYQQLYDKWFASK
jgi:polar amino acid transport system substrate-binding protein